MKFNFTFYKNVFYQPLRTDLIVLRKSMLDKIINLFIWVGCTVVILGYIMTAQFGLSADFACFTLTGCIASAGLFEVFPSVANIIMDLEGDRHLSYHLTLPVPSWLILSKMICYYAFNVAFMTALVVPIGKLLLWNQFALSNIDFLKFACIFFSSSIFYGSFVLLITSFVSNMALIENVWMRFVFPLWFLGGFQFSWQALHKLVPQISYIGLLNPITYIMEGTRAATLGQEGYLPFWPCVGMLCLFSALACWVGIARLKKRLDFV